MSTRRALKALKRMGLNVKPMEGVEEVIFKVGGKELVGMNIVVLANLKPKKFMGVESKGMLLAADVDGRPVLLTVAGDVPPGTKVA